MGNYYYTISEINYKLLYMYLLQLFTILLRHNILNPMFELKR